MKAMKSPSLEKAPDSNIKTFIFYLMVKRTFRSTFNIFFVVSISNFDFHLVQL